MVGVVRIGRAPGATGASRRRDREGRGTPRLPCVTPEQLSTRIGALAGRRVRVRPDPSRPPHRWVADLRGSVRSAAEITAALDDLEVTADGDRLIVTLDEAHLVTALERAAAVAGPAWDEPARDHLLTLTRDGAEQVSYAALAESVGAIATRWAVLRSSDGRQIDCACADLATLTPRNPVFSLLLAVTRSAQQPTGDADVVAALTAEWPLVVADAERTGRTRSLALHLEALADAAGSWWEMQQPAGHEAPAGSQSPEGGSPVSGPFAAWTGERLARASRIVLVAGLSAAGIEAPTRI